MNFGESQWGEPSISADAIIYSNGTGGLYPIPTFWQWINDNIFIIVLDSLLITVIFGGLLIIISYFIFKYKKIGKPLKYVIKRILPRRIVIFLLVLFLLVIGYFVFVK